MQFNFTVYSQLISYGVHIGHSWRNSLLFSSWMVYSFRQNILLINLFKFLNMFKLGFLLSKKVLYNFAPIWFINLDRSVSQVIQYSALRCGEFFVNNNWIRGLVSNYFSVFNAYRRLNFLSSLIKSRKNKKFQQDLKYWILTRMTWPRALFISSVSGSYLACKEAFSLKIPSIGIVDTNTYSQSVHIAVPGNDESIDCLVFYNETISNYVLLYKFKLILFWFLNVRRVKRLLSFNEWLFSKKSIKSELNLNLYNYSFYNVFLKSLEIFYSMNNLKEFHLFKIISKNVYEINLENAFFNLTLFKKKYLSMMRIFFMQVKLKKGTPYKHFLKRVILSKVTNRFTRQSLFTHYGLLKLKKGKYFRNKFRRYTKSHFIRFFLYMFFLSRFSKHSLFKRFVVSNWKIKRFKKVGLLSVKKWFIYKNFLRPFTFLKKKIRNYNLIKFLRSKVLSTKLFIQRKSLNKNKILFNSTFNNKNVKKNKLFKSNSVDKNNKFNKISFRKNRNKLVNNKFNSNKLFDKNSKFNSNKLFDKNSKFNSNKLFDKNSKFDKNKLFDKNSKFDKNNKFNKISFRKNRNKLVNNKFNKKVKNQFKSVKRKVSLSLLKIKKNKFKSKLLLKVKNVKYKKHGLIKRFLLSGNLLFNKLLPRVYWNFYKKNVMLSLSGNSLKRKKMLSKYYRFGLKIRKYPWDAIRISKNKMWGYAY